MKKNILKIIKMILSIHRKIFLGIKKLKLKIYGVQIGKNLIFAGSISQIGHTLLVNPNNIYMGDNVYIGNNFYCNGYNKVIIGNNIMISHNVALISANHKINKVDYTVEREIYEKTKPIIIGNGTWLGYSVSILPGISIGKGVVIGANSVITKDIPDYAIVVGNPGKIIGSIKD